MYIAQLNSTNDYLKTHPDVDMVYTDYQTAGRGQMGNGWESERTKNVLMSIRLIHTDLPAKEQWQVCMMASVALWQTVAQCVDDTRLLRIKWPNDLYYGDKKLAGMLIEHSLCGNTLASSIIGIGLNVNQEQWIGNAPNPISIKGITGREYEVAKIVHLLENNLHNVGLRSNETSKTYEQLLYRRQGWWWWEEREVDIRPTMNGQLSDQSFEAKIKHIDDQGELVLEKRNGETKKYHFKQIKYIL